MLQLNRSASREGPAPSWTAYGLGAAGAAAGGAAVATTGLLVVVTTASPKVIGSWAMLPVSIGAGVGSGAALVGPSMVVTTRAVAVGSAGVRTCVFAVASALR